MLDGINRRAQSIFDRCPFEEQPACLADMGCGAGAPLRRTCELICERTARGCVLDHYFG
jgi:hypothetical protein